MSEELDLSRREFVKTAAAAGVLGAGLISASGVALAGAGAPPVTMGDAAGAWGKLPPLMPKTFAKVAEGAGKISKTTFTRHFVLYNGYVNKVSEIAGKLKNVGLSNANQIFSDLRALKVDFSFAWGGLINHEIYFGNLGGKGGEPEGKLADAIKRDFGSFAGFKADKKATGIAARGWVWLATTPEGYLFNFIGDAQNTYPL